MSAARGHQIVRYAMVTPVRDEDAYIGAMIDSIAAQTVLPSCWIIVNDGSRDRTEAILRASADRFGFLRLLSLPRRDERFAGGEGAVPTALRQLDPRDYEFIARFDGDLLFPPNYVAQILNEFDRDPRLGIAGGVLYVYRNGRLIAERDQATHVRGALKIYRCACFLDIGGLTDRIGWDTLDETMARTKGWETRGFMNIVAIHRRPTGEGISACRVYRQRGRAEYLTWSDPLFVFGKALKIAITKLSVLKPVSYLWGFLVSYAQAEARVCDPAIAQARRGEQRNRIRRLLMKPMRPVETSLPVVPGH